MQTAWKVSIGTMVAALAVGGIAVFTAKANAPAGTEPQPNKQSEWRPEPAQRAPQTQQFTEQAEPSQGTMPREGSWEKPEPTPEPKPEIKKPGDVTPEQHQKMLDLLNQPKPKPAPLPLRDESKSWYNCPNCHRHGKKWELKDGPINGALYCPECHAQVFEPRRKPVVQGR